MLGILLPGDNRGHSCSLTARELVGVLLLQGACSPSMETLLVCGNGEEGWLYVVAVRL